MKIYNVVREANGNFGRNITFNRKLKETEKKDYTKTITDTMDYLGIVNRALIIHGSSFPADKERDVDQRIGSPYNADAFLEFAKLHGFNGIQLGPNGKLNKGDTSPYSSSIFAKNPLFIDFSQLATPKFASILSEDELYGETYEVESNGKNYDVSDYKEAQVVTDRLMDKAYANFKEKLAQEDAEAQKLNEEFRAFQDENSYWLEYYSVLDVISNKYGTDYYPHWSKEDAQLIQGVKQAQQPAIARYNQIRKDNADYIEKYKFTQFVVDKQAEEDTKKRGDFVYIGDLLVGASSFDEMIFADVFKPGYKIGAKNGGVFDSPQLWNVPLVDPDKLFKPNGELAEGGEFLRLKVKKALQDAKNIRIDHAMGLVDPFIYKPETVVYGTKMDNGKEVSYPLREKLQAGFLSQMGIDRKQNYQRVIPEIILPVLKEANIDPKSAVWEDLGYDETGVFNRIFRKQEGLPGMNVLLWDRGETSKPENWAFVTCHDNPPTAKVIESNDKNPNAWNLDYLAGYLNPSSRKPYQRSSFRDKIARNPHELLKAKYAELMRSTKNIQISFMDFFGINKQYNTPGTIGPQNWTLRLNSDYEDTYYKSLANNENAMNMPEILSIALQAKADMDVARGLKTQAQSDGEIAPMMKKLGEYSSILKEKE